MNYAASRHLVPAPGDGADVSLPWETGNETSLARQETWLLSFIDILALLLTLFVLLLAHQERGLAEPGSAVATDQGSSLSIDFSLQGLNLANAAPVDLLPDTTPAAIGYRIPGDGLLPQEGEVVEGPPEVVEVLTPDPVDTEPQPPAAASDEGTEPMTGVSAAVEPVSAEQISEQTVELPPTVVQQAQQGPPGTDHLAKLTEESVPGPHAAANQLLETLNQTVLGDRVEMTVQRGTVSLDISDSILFNPASAALSAEGLALLNELAAVLQTLPYQLSVEGHTDNVPIRTAVYPSNWELSSARAARVTRKLIEQGLAADRIRAIGYGETRPRSDNNDAAGRAKNRRVTFVLQVETEPVSVAVTR